MAGAPEPVPLQTVVGVGASAGGVEALTRLAGLLPPDLPAAVLVVLHVSPRGTSVLAQILDRHCRLAVEEAEDGVVLEAGHVYVAPPDRHLVVEAGRVRLTLAPRENGHRPAVDPLLRSLAIGYGPGAVGIVLSGTRDDGTAGLANVKAAGGRTLVQDPGEALYRGMPDSAIRTVDVDAVLGIAALAEDVTRFARREEGEPMAADPPALDRRDGDPTRYTCPECGGMLMRREDAGVRQFACSVGHVYSPDSLDAEQDAVIEGALWAGARMLEDRAEFLNEMADRTETLGHERSAREFRARAQESLSRSNALRGMLQRTAASAEDAA